MVAEPGRQRGRATVSAPAFLDELAAAGIRLALAGDNLRFTTAPGVSIAPFRERVVTHKPDLLAALHLQAEIIAAATVAIEAFDRLHYDQLWARWYALEWEEATP